LTRQAPGFVWSGSGSRLAEASGWDTVSRDLGFTPEQSFALQGFASAAIAQAIPQPETYALMAMGMGVVGWMARRRRRLGATA
jgi:hypothetical protein